MVNFAELKAKAEKAKDAGVAKVVNTKDKYSSIPASKTTWDPNWKRAPPPSSVSPPPSHSTNLPSSSFGTNVHEAPPAPSRRSRPDSISSSASAHETNSPPPVIPRASRPDTLSRPESEASSLPPPPKRFSSGYPPNHKRTDSRNDAVEKIDWANLSAEDKEEFFLWLDEFFSRFLNVELGPRKPNVALSVPDHKRSHVPRTGPPPVNAATRPHLF
ncbi:hypothetical protein V8B97DRAFT_400456 [Scleroderma yunnanense]